MSTRRRPGPRRRPGLAQGGSPWAPAGRAYPRSARVNQLLQEVVAEELERLADGDERLRLLTVTGVEAAPDLRQATVLLAVLEEPAEIALSEARMRVQAAISRQIRLKRTPHLSFAADPAIAEGRRIDDVLRHLAGHRPPGPEGEPGPGAFPPPGS
ncbi:MAG: 30S ribosome-binding factor RbfA [Acidimicrobiales bacterium]